MKPAVRQGATTGVKPSAAERTLPLFKDQPVCRFPGCKATHDAAYPMCWTHFRLVPDAVRSQYWDLKHTKPDSPALPILVARMVSLARAPAPLPVAPGRTADPSQKPPEKVPRRIQLPIRPKSDYDPRAHGALCDSCPCKNRTVVPPTPVAAHIGPPAGAIVGMAPGWEEQRQRKSFVGLSGKKLDRILEKNRLDRKTFHITNAALCLPEKDEHFHDAYKCCKPRLEAELKALPHHTPIIPLGAAAFHSAFGRKIPITQARGFIWTHKDGRTFLPTVHPSYVLRDAVQSPLWNIDWNRIGRFIRGEVITTEPKSWIVPKTASELLKALSLFKHDTWVACDIETTKDKPTRCDLLCVGISNGKSTVVVPWDNKFKVYLAAFFKDRTVVGHNFIAFDSIVLERYGIKTGKIEDTLIAHHAYASHFRQGMDHVASVYLDVPPWKVQYGLRGTDEKGQPKGNLSNDELIKYNAYDAYIQAWMYVKMKKDIDANRKLVEHDHEVADVCREMTINGVWVDEKRRKEIADALRAKINRLFLHMKEMCGHDFAPTKPSDLRKIFFDEFKAPVLERTPKKQEPSTGKATLREFALKVDRPHGKFAADLIQWRLCCKVLKTHVEGLPIDKDGRVHASWKSFATPTGRPGCIAKGSLIEVVRDVSKFPKGVPIEDVKIGDFAYSYTRAGNLVLRRVTNVMHNGIRPVVRVRWRGTGHKYEGYLDLTADHRVRLTNGQWIAAGDLKPGFHITAMSRDIHAGYGRIYPTGSDPIREHRFVFHQLTGRRPPHVHHRDHNRLNNRFDNLEGMKVADHLSHHGRNISDATRKKFSANTKRLWAEGRMNPPKGADHPGWLRLNRNTIYDALKASGWSVVKAGRLLGHDFESFKRHVAEYFDIDLLKRMNQAAQAGRAPDRYDSRLVYMSLNDISREEMERLFAANKWALAKTAAAAQFEYYAFKARVVELGFDLIEIEKRNRALVPRGRAAWKLKQLALQNNHMVLAVEPLGEVDVYDLEIDKTHNFIANELCVHNCRGPNLNNMKREDNRFEGEPEYRIREIYAALPGKRFVGFDFSQIEPNMSAYLSGDPEFIAAVDTGDIHTAIARIIFGENTPELKDSKTAKTAGKWMRSISKSCGLAVSYGAGEETLYHTLRSDGADIKFSRVVVMLSTLRRRFKVYFEYVDQNIAYCRKHGYIIAGFLSGRKRWLGHAPEPQKISNTPCQGGAADVMNHRMIELRKYFNDKYGRGVVKMVAQVYDSIIFECATKLVEEVKTAIKRILSKPFLINGRSFTPLFELKDGERWSEV